MAGKDVFGRCPGEPVELRSGSTRGRSGSEFFEQRGVSILKIHDFLLQSDDGRPFLFEQACVFGCRVGHKVWMVGFYPESVVGGSEARVVEIVEDGFMALRERGGQVLLERMEKRGYRCLQLILLPFA